MFPLLLLSLFGGAQAPEPSDPDGNRLFREPVKNAPRGLPPGLPWIKPEPELRIACPRCKAAIGAGCDRRTLGNKRFHFARVEAGRLA